MKCEECEFYYLDKVNDFISLHSCTIADNSWVVRPLAEKEDCELYKEAENEKKREIENLW